MFSLYFNDDRLALLHRLVDLALEEDGRDLTSEALFPPASQLEASIVAKEETLVAGLPLIDIVFERMRGPRPLVTLLASDADAVARGREVARIRGSAPILLKAERVIMNFICHLSGVANATSRFVQAVEGTGVRVLDTRKTTPGQRYLEKYAVRMGGGHNHRANLEEMLMLKDNHIDQAGSITAAVCALRKAYDVCPPLEVECRTLETRTRGRESFAPAHHARQHARGHRGRGPAAHPAPHRIGDQRQCHPGDHPRPGRTAADVHLNRRHHPLRHRRGLLHAPDTKLPGECMNQEISAIRDRLGKELCILAHHYQADEVVRHADILGDSLELARHIDGLEARHIVFCGVHFMAETAAILARPEQKVHIPDPGASCVMAEMVPALLAEEVLARLNRDGARIIPLTYVNSSAAVKAVCGNHGGSVCTSANAPTMLRWALAQGDGVLFLPDANLGRNTARIPRPVRERDRAARHSGSGALRACCRPRTQALPVAGPVRRPRQIQYRAGDGHPRERAPCPDLRAPGMRP